MSSESPILRTLLVDDEPLARRGLRHLLKAEPDIHIVAECETGEDAVAALARDRPDLIFLDVQMPGMDGFEVLQSAAPQKIPFVVFVTAFERYAPAAFDSAAIDYLLKPVTSSRLQKTLQRVRERWRERKAAAVGPDSRSLPSLTSSSTQENIVVRTGNRLEVIPLNEVKWLEADGDYVRIHGGSRTHLLAESLTALLQRLGSAQFARIHRSRAVNFEWVQALQRRAHGEFTLILKTGEKLEAGRSFTPALKARFRQR
jgi:two-component system, LytTR family, response regulator